MKKLIILSIFTITTLNLHAQVIALNENFNVYCAVLGENYPPLWSGYDNLADPLISWTCTSGGRGTTPTSTSPGISCTNYDGINYYVDTAWLFTPSLNLNWMSGNVYLQFDSKYIADAGGSGAAGRLSLLVSNDYQAGWPPDTVLAGHTWYDVTSTSDPVLGNSGSSDWVTHVVNLTPYKASPMYVAFRYTSSLTNSGTWIVDNVLTTQIPFTAVPVIEKNICNLSVVGNCTPGQVTLSFSAPYASTYQLEMYDAVGRKVYKEALDVQPGTATHTINSLDLQEGMYLVKMGNGSIYSTTKVMIR